jgi:hypothetical protein
VYRETGEGCGKMDLKGVRVEVRELNRRRGGMVVEMRLGVGVCWASGGGEK